jgi:aminopeptidase C
MKKNKNETTNQKNVGQCWTAKAAAKNIPPDFGFNH